MTMALSSSSRVTITTSYDSYCSPRKRPWSSILCCCLLVLPATTATNVSTEPERRPLPPVIVRKQQLSPESYARNSGDKEQKVIPPLDDAKHKDFVKWCRQLLGIDSLLEIQTFSYPNYMKAHYVNHWARLEESQEDEVEVDNISVRGLAAIRDIAIGEIVLSIPLHAIVSVPTTIDHDPVLSRVMGRKERDRWGWNEFYFELPLLSVAILHHIHTLGPKSPMSLYMQMLNATTMDHMPILWNRTRLQQETTEAVYKIVRGIQKDIVELYEAVVPILLREHPTVFDPAVLTLQNFTWAFALVHSRHWNLPVPTAEDQPQQSNIIASPPADKPTEEWLSTAHQQRDAAIFSAPHSFLPPLADLLNFGPPCTRGHYSADAFELIATCTYQKGQEVTFWYADDCDDAMIANFGFSHPMVPSCLLRDEAKSTRFICKETIHLLESELDTAYEDLEKLDRELERLGKVLQQCHCDDTLHGHTPITTFRARTLPPAVQRQEAAEIRGTREEDTQRHGVRRQVRENRRSEGL